ncbi:Hint domain-containing protein [Aliiroseovarius subalbicans]|uniref:Hint domain-containing protein n=1 Tax=Aliiroseovarius subalbicans TaxID=2925840 RepID=UPI001F55FFB1|nr:Hint domain-containing protein [Aliiroseovarius subalbicans]MCI2397980.1 Hint domain-containing protein [Aliiroseovarius subalbicans]
MTVTFTAPDNEFAAATGSNVNVTSTTSLFDNPPNGFSDLVITSNPGDNEPYKFDIGDTYDVTYGGHGGGGVIEDAEVVRTDVLSGGEGIVVLEGIDSNSGEMVQVIWTPGFDLETWYWDNYNPSSEPGFYVVDTDGGSTYGHVCLAAETRVQTDGGLRPLRDLSVGDLVHTRDHGSRPVTWLGAHQMTGVGAAAPVLFAPGAIGNAAPLRLSQQHRVMLAHPLAEFYHGSSEVLMPAKSLVNGEMIRIAPSPHVTWMNLTTDDHDIITAEGAAVETLWLGEVALNVLGEADAITARYPELNGQGHARQQSARPMLRHREAQALIRLIVGTRPTDPPPVLSAHL